MLLFLNVIYVLIAIAMVALILMQRGAGAQAGSGFGGGASGTVFGARGASNFLSKATKWLAIAFFSISLFMAWQATHNADGAPDCAGPRLDVAGSGGARQGAGRQPGGAGSSGGPAAAPAIERSAGAGHDSAAPADAAGQPAVATARAAATAVGWLRQHGKINQVSTRLARIAGCGQQ